MGIRPSYSAQCSYLQEQPMYNFKKDLKRGDAGEAEFGKIFPVSLIKNTNKYGVDFIIPSLEKTLELKTEYYVSDNFFFERYGDIDKKTPGGPWRALIEHADYYCHYFPKMNSYYVFDTQELVFELDRLVEGRNLLKHVNQGNNGAYVSGGYLIPKTWVSKLYLDIKQAGSRLAR